MRASRLRSYATSTWLLAISQASDPFASQRPAGRDDKAAAAPEEEGVEHGIPVGRIASAPVWNFSRFDSRRGASEASGATSSRRRARRPASHRPSKDPRPEARPRREG